MKKIVALLACIAVSCVSFQACGQNKELNIQPPSSGNTGGDDKTPEPEPGPVDNIATRRTMQMGLGWNLGNNLDAYEEDPEDKDYLMPSETVWGNPNATQQAINKVKEAGFTTIRIPVTWLAKIGPAPEPITPTPRRPSMPL